MTGGRVVVLAIVLLLVSAAGVGAVPTTQSDMSDSAAPQNGSQPLGASISMFMQSQTAQANGAVENGMWVTRVNTTSNSSKQRVIVEQRISDINRTLFELQSQRQSLQAAFRNGTVNRTTYIAELAFIAGQLAALDRNIESADEQGERVGVNASRLETLRNTARELTGPEVSAIARNLTENGPPFGESDLFNGSAPGQAGGQGPANASNRSTVTDRGDDRGQGPPGNESRGKNDQRSENAGNQTRENGNDGQGSNNAGNQTRGNGNDGQGSNNAGNETRGNGTNGQGSDNAGNETRGNGTNGQGSDNAGHETRGNSLAGEPPSDGSKESVGSKLSPPGRPSAEAYDN